jgi:hypothetical protein
MPKSSTSPSVRAGAAVGLIVAIAVGVLITSWLTPGLLASLVRGNGSDLRLRLFFAAPPFFAAALWFSRRSRAVMAWWLAWAIALLITSLCLVVTVGLRAMGDDIQSHGLIP